MTIIDINYDLLLDKIQQPDYAHIKDAAQSVIDTLNASDKEITLTNIRNMIKQTRAFLASEDMLTDDNTVRNTAHKITWFVRQLSNSEPCEDCD